jgi:hypothetical protein
MKMTSVYAPITKSVEDDDGTIYVYGKATGSDLDLDYQRCDPDWLKRAMPEWFGVGSGAGGNIRGQHNRLDAVGKAVEHDVLSDGHYIKAHIVDPVAVLKTKTGVYTGFSIGINQPRIEKSTTAPNGVIKDGKIFEVSLVDRPALPTAQFTMCKAAKPGMQVKSGDFDAKRLLVRCEEFVEKAEDSGEMTVKLGDAMPPEKLRELEEKVAESSGKTAEPDLEKTDDADGDKRWEWLRKSYTGEFDRQAALDLIKAENDLPPEYDAEQVDIENAQSAIAILSQLIISEASEMCDNPAEDCDIQILLEAVQALRCFIHREQQQAMGADVIKKPVPVFLSVDPDLNKAKYSADQLRQMLKEGKAMRNPAGEPSYPIGDKKDLSNAIHAVGRGSGDHNSIRAYIKRRAKALGASNMIPADWTSSGTNNGSGKSVEPEMEKTMGAEETEVLEKSAVAEVEEIVEPEEVAKSVEAEEPPADVLYKAFSALLEKDDNPLFKSFEAIIEKSMAATAGQLGELSERLGRIEQMPLPGGPSLKRTENEQKGARVSDMTDRVKYFEALVESVDDPDLQKGYAAMAAGLKAEINALTK